MRILFVDDEPMVLGGLSRLLWRHQPRWQMQFVSSGRAALSALAEAPFDLVVSDLRMSGMDGAALLRAVADQYPGAVRFVLSGQADSELVTRAMPVTHQYLHKPCSAATLVAAIAGVETLRSQLPDEALRALAGSVDAFPVSPGPRQAMRDVVERSWFAVADVVEVVEQSPAMAAKVLHLANSSCFGVARGAASLSDAIAAVGVERIRALVQGGELFGADALIPESPIEPVAAHSVATARLARAFMTTPAEGDLAFAAGLVHQVGRMALARRGQAQDVPGAGHTEVGAYLLGLWGIPAAIVDAVAHHHEPRGCPPRAARSTAVLHVASAVALAGGAAFDGAIDLAWLDAAGLADEADRWRRIALGAAG